MLYLANARDLIEFSQHIGDNARKSGKKEIQKDIDWLKSLRPQPHWKPSEEQMEALEKVLHRCPETLDTDKAKVLWGLFDQLKKLM